MMEDGNRAGTADVQDTEVTEIHEKSGGTRPAGDRTNVHLSGTGAVETDDGLDEEAEAMRHAAEDRPDEPNPYLAAADEATSSGDEEEDEERAVEDQPVFDRASSLG